MNQSASLPIKSLKPRDRVAYLLATGFGAGLAPTAPGTVGALEAVAVFGLLVAAGFSSLVLLLALLALDLISFFLGVWASSRTCDLTHCEDPGQIVIDEVNGQLIALTPLAVSPSWPGAVMAFLLFRLFDITKPYPINRLEQWHGGLGVMADDALAGIYAAVPVALFLYFQII